MYNVTEFPDEMSDELWLELMDAVEKKGMSLNIGYFISMILIFLIGVIGNVLTCIVIYCDKSMHTATNYYLFDLALSDFIVAFGILLEVSGYPAGLYRFENYELGKIVCKSYTFLIVALWNNGILILTVLSIERYTAIWHPLLVKSTPVWRRVTKIIALIWVVAILESLPEAWIYTLVYTKTSAICFPLPSSFAKIVNGVLGLVTFVIPLAIMIFVYTMIAFKVNLSQISNSRDKIFNNRVHRKKVNKLIVALTVSFLVCWLPFFIVRILLLTCNARQYVELIKTWDLWIQIVSVNSWFSIVLNPMLFSLISTKFRKALKNLWNTKIMRRKTGHRGTIGGHTTKTIF